MRRNTEIDLTKSKIYIIGPDSLEEKTLIRNTVINAALNADNFLRITFIQGAYMPRDPNIGCAMSHALAIEQALQFSDRPFVLLENDALSESNDFNIEFPADADAVYLGTSTGGLAMNSSSRIHHWNGNFYSKTHISGIVRIYNMLSTHAVLINTERFARNWQLCAVEASLRNVPIDTLIAATMQYFNVYALQEPLLFQDIHLGGQEKYTKTNFEGIEIECKDELPMELKSFRQPCIACDLAEIRSKTS